MTKRNLDPHDPDSDYWQDKYWEARKKYIDLYGKMEFGNWQEKNIRNLPYIPDWQEIVRLLEKEL